MLTVSTFKALVALLLVYAVLRAGRGGGRSLPSDIEAVVADLLNPAPEAVRRDWLRASGAIVVLGVVFAILMAKFDGGLVLKWPFDQLWHQALIDYDALWRTPVFSMPGNLLNQFDMRPPVTSHLMPAIGLSELFPRPWRVTASYSFLFAGMMLLFWSIGATFGLRPLPRAIFAGLVGLMAVIPVGIDKIVWFFPVNFFTTQSLLATWWGEAPMLALATILAFYWIGGFAGTIKNVLIALVFALGCFLAVFAYPGGAVYFVPIIAVYCAVFLLTSRVRNEAIWKLAAGGAVAALMLALQVPRFFENLYGYTYGSFFLDRLRVPAAGLIADTFMIASRGIDPRAVFVFVIATTVAIFLASQGPAPARRFAIGALATEVVIVLASLANAFTVGAPMLFSYAETAHSALWGSFFVLVAMAVAVLIDRCVAALPVVMPRLHPLARHRHAVYGVALAIALTLFAVASPPPAILHYPPNSPPTVAALARDFALRPGAPFRGKVLTIYRRDGDLFEAKALGYRALFGSDFLTDMLPHGIPMLNQSHTWTSPVTFAFLFNFFADAGDRFEKNAFWLHRFDGNTAGKIGRLLGVSAVVSDMEIAGATLTETLSRDGRRLRVYRLGDTNLGQYSPVRPQRVGRADQAIAIIASDSFDPKVDVVVEEAVPAGLAPAQSVSVRAETGPALHVRAISSGRSLIVLPFEYSHCLRLSGSDARLLPVNLQQIGLLFDRAADVRIEYRYGVSSSGCRGEDLARAKALDIGAIVRTRER